jgi:hypothetical protein
MLKCVFNAIHSSVDFFYGIILHFIGKRKKENLEGHNQNFKVNLYKTTCFLMITAGHAGREERDRIENLKLCA